MKLTWNDVDWERGRITIHSPKTKHHPGQDSRQIPIFPELQPYLHVVCAWIGNSQPIATKHYLQVTDDHFTQAAAPIATTPPIPACSALHNAMQHAAA